MSPSIRHPVSTTLSISNRHRIDDSLLAGKRAVHNAGRGNIKSWYATLQNWRTWINLDVNSGHQLICEPDNNDNNGDRTFRVQSSPTVLRPFSFGGQYSNWPCTSRLSLAPPCCDNPTYSTCCQCLSQSSLNLRSLLP